MLFFRISKSFNHKPVLEMYCMPFLHSFKHQQSSVSVLVSSDGQITAGVIKSHSFMLLLSLTPWALWLHSKAIWNIMVSCDSESSLPSWHVISDASLGFAVTAYDPQTVMGKPLRHCLYMSWLDRWNPMHPIQSWLKCHISYAGFHTEKEWDSAGKKCKKSISIQFSADTSTISDKWQWHLLRPAKTINQTIYRTHTHEHI